MTKLLILVAAVAACTSEPTTPLARLDSNQLQVVANGQLNIILHVDGNGCPKLEDNVVATFDGMPMNVARGGYATNATGCFPIAFWFDTMPSAAIADYEARTLGSEFVVADRSATWTLDSANKLFGNDFEIQPQNNLIVWEDVSTISQAEIAPVAPTTIDGNTIHYPAGTMITWVSGIAHPTPASCDGPTGCEIDVSGQRTFKSGE
ncbi:MAG TPA: hypothetical protein VLX92_06945 [Kofleriaceae bacterium]|nr:hypothetical protein [Kofleriaceae bacterium]